MANEAKMLVTLTTEDLEALIERGVRKALAKVEPEPARRSPITKPRKRARPTYHPPTGAVPVDDVSRARARRALRRSGIQVP
jgi:hypothetical protein